MKNIFTKLFVVVIALFSFAASSVAQNLYTETPTYYASFENTTALYFSNTPTPASSFSIEASTDMALNGSRSLKISCPDPSVLTGGNATMILGGTTDAYMPGNVTLAAGDYTFKAKVYVVDQAPVSIVVYIAEKSAGILNGSILIVPTTGIVAGSWQSIEATFNAPVAGDYKTGIRLRGTVDYKNLTGPSTIYLDNMQIVSGITTAMSTPNVAKFKLFSTESSLVITVSESSDLDIYNMSGKKINSFKSVEGKLEMPTTKLSKGVYLAKVNCNGAVSTQKFIVH